MERVEAVGGVGVTIPVKEWKRYMETTGVLVDVNKCVEKLREYRKLARAAKKSGVELDGSTRYKKTMVENLVMSSSGYLNGSYLEPSAYLMDLIESGVSSFRVFPSYSLSSTYRLSSNTPSIGNLDTSLRELIVPREGCYFVSLDYRQQEPWIIVNLLQDDELMEVLLTSDDFYMGILSRFEIPETVENREAVKKVWNASIYGSSLDTVLKKEHRWVVDVYEWINTNERVLSLRRKVEKNMKEDKEIYTEFGFRKSVPYSGTRSVRQAFNSIFQMSGAGVLYAGINSIHNAVALEGFTGKLSLVFTNHDEYVLEVSEELDWETVRAFLLGIDFSVLDWTLPRFNILRGESWGELND